MSRRKTCRDEYRGYSRISWNSIDGLEDLIHTVNALNERDQTKFLFVNPNVATTGSGGTLATAMKTFTEAVAYIAALGSAALRKGWTIVCLPGLSYEAAGIAISFDDLLVVGPGAPDGFILIGTGTAGVLDAATTHTLIISGSKCTFVGLSLYCYKDTKAAVYLGSATATGFTGSYNKFVNCYFSQQADGNDMGFGVYLQGAKETEILNCTFKGCKSGAVMAVNSTIRGVNDLRISGCFIQSCKYGLEMDGDGHDVLIDNNIIIDGTNTGEVLTKCVMTTANHAAGSIHVVGNKLATVDKTSSMTKTGAGTVVHIGNTYLE